MIGKKNVFVLVSILVMFLGGVFLVIVLNKTPVVEKFDLNDYQYYIDNFSSEENVGSIIDAKDAIKKAEIIWIKLYGESIKKEKPFKVFYDDKNEVWLIHGTLPVDVLGGVASILIEDDTGKVLAVWHDK